MPILEISILSSISLTPPSHPICPHILRKCVLIPVGIVTPPPSTPSLSPSSQGPEFPNHALQLGRSGHHQPWEWVWTVSTAHSFWLQQSFRKWAQDPVQTNEMWRAAWWKRQGKECPQSCMGTPEMNAFSPTRWIREHWLLPAILLRPHGQPV